MKKYYRVIKDNFLWEDGAILEINGSDNGYKPTTDVFDKSEYIKDEYISSRIIENSPEYFERVYEVNLVNKVVYQTKEQFKKTMSSFYKGDQ